MKIKRLKLVNFIGIKHGLDRDSVEIDFTKTNNKIIMLLGGNGAGKSVIMSMLHPFKESFDERKDLIIDGCTGEKEIDIEHDGHIYEIYHTYAKSAQSFIKKDGVELNESGGVRTFESIIERELGLTKEYFKIGKIGSNTKNFVDFTTLDRKNYIGNFLNIEDILEKYQVANNALKALKRDITSASSDLAKFQNKDVVDATISQITESAKTTESSLFELFNRKGELTAELNLIGDAADQTTLNDLVQRITDKQNDITNNKILKTDIIEKHPDIETVPEEITEEISKLQTEISVMNNDLSNKNLLLNDYENKITSTKIEISSLGNPVDIEKIKTETSELSARKDELSTSIRNHQYGTLVRDIVVNRKDVQKLLSKTMNMLDFVEKFFTDLNKTNIVPNRKDIESFLSDDYEDVFARVVSQGKKLLTSKKDRENELYKSRCAKETHICQLKNLEKRPEACTIDTCPFIKDAYEHRNVVSEIAVVDSELTAVRREIDSLTTKQENLQEVQNLYKNFANLYSELNIRENDIYRSFVSEKTLLEWVSGSLSDFQVAKQNLADGISEVLRNLSEHNVVKQKLVNLENTIKIMEDSDSSVRSKYEKDLEEYSNRKSEIECEIQGIKQNIAEKTIVLNSKRELSEAREKYYLAISKINSASTMLSTATSEYKKLTEAVTRRTEIEVELNKVNTEICTLEQLKAQKQNNLDNAKATLAQINVLSEKLAKLNNEYAPVAAVAEALSPKKGIPLILMKMYLEETEAITNDLLDVAFGGDFKIQFVTTDKEFAIQVQSKGNTKSDIKMASQGEIAITTISISLALIEQSIGGYNILCLDEIDGHLDAGNRNNFMDILNSQINKLGIEQVFVISHNDAFDTAPVGMVLLRGNTVNKSNTSFMENKDVIFDIENI